MIKKNTDYYNRPSRCAHYYSVFFFFSIDENGGGEYKTNSVERENPVFSSE